MARTIDFIFDFGSPNAYLAWKVLPGFAEKHGADIKYCPALLGGIFKATNNQAPWQTYGGVKGKLDYERLELNRFITRHGLPKFRFNPHFPVNTLLLMRGAVATMRDSTMDTYLAAGMTAMWEDGLNMSDPNTFVDVMNKAGLEGHTLLAATQETDIKSELMNVTAAVVARGVFGIPTFFIDDEMFFGKDRIRDLTEYL